MARSIDRPTVDRLVVEHLPAALAFATRLTGDADVAEDVVQETLCRVLRRWRGYRGEAEFKTWLFQIVLNVDRDRRRRVRRERPLPSAPMIARIASPAEQSAANELDARVRTAIDRLPRRQREVAVLTYGEGLAPREVACLLKTSEANVHTCLHLARKRIARALGMNQLDGKPS